MTELGCNQNQLTQLPDLPVGLTLLRCNHNQLTQLPELPAGLIELWCFRNQLTQLPALPVGLTLLWCNHNQLTQLPELPAGLTLLWCFQNQLTQLPELPVGLTQLRCNQNQLTQLPDLPAGLTQLWCSQNFLDVWADPIKSNIENTQVIDYSSINSQYAFRFNENYSLLQGISRQILNTELRKSFTSDGSTFLGGNAADLSKFTFSSSDITIATVDAGGKVTAVSIGNCVIKAVYNNIDTNFTTAELAVEVTAPATQACYTLLGA